MESRGVEGDGDSVSLVAVLWFLLDLVVAAPAGGRGGQLLWSSQWIWSRSLWRYLPEVSMVDFVGCVLGGLK